MKPFLSLIFIVFLVSCSNFQNDHSKFILDDVTISPTDTVEFYIKQSSENNLDNVKTITIQPPEIFYTCYFESIKECEEKIIIEKETSLKASTSINIINNDSINDVMLKKISEKIPRAIANKYWNKIIILNSWKNDTQARVRVFIKGKNFSFTNDVLLYKKDNSWKIFAFVEEGSHEAYGGIQSEKPI